MGVLDWFLRSVPEVTEPSRFAVHSPDWFGSGDQLTANMMIADAFGLTHDLATRTNAMGVPAMKKARLLITSLGAAAVWRSYTDETVDADQPRFLYTTSGALSPWHRMVWTLDDLLFYGWSLWGVRRNADRSISDAWRIPPSDWEFEKGQVKVGGQVADPSTVLLFPGSDEGVLATSGDSILGAQTIEREWQKRIRNPVPITELHNNDANDPITVEERDKLIADYNARRRTSDGVTTYTPANIDLRVHGEQVTDLFVAGRNASALDVARITGLPALMLDTASINAANQNYSNKETARNDLLDAIRDIYLAPIEARLSLDDVVPRGHSVRADLSERIEVPGEGTGTPRED